MVFNPDGTRRAIGISPSTARIWDAAPGKLLLALRVKPQPDREQLPAVAFSPDSHWFATNGTGFTARIWAGFFGLDDLPAVAAERRLRSIFSRWESLFHPCRRGRF